MIPVDTIIGLVGEECGVPADVIRSRSRTVAASAARHAAELALVHAGMTPAQIARELRLDHGSVCHGIARARADPELVRVARASQLTLAALLGQACRAYPLTQAGAVRAYVLVTLLAGAPSSAGMTGLWLISRDAALREQVTAALVTCSLGQHVWRIEWHCRQAGLRWVAA